MKQKSWRHWNLNEKELSPPTFPSSQQDGKTGQKDRKKHLQGRNLLSEGLKPPTSCVFLWFNETTLQVLNTS